MPTESRLALLRDRQAVAVECAALPVELGADVIDRREIASVVAHRIESCEGSFIDPKAILVPWLAVPHPSGRVRGTRPELWEGIEATFAKAAEISRKRA